MKVFPASIAQLPALRLVIAAGALVLAAVTQWLPSAPATVGNEWLRDRFALHGAAYHPESRIVVVDIDDGSLAEFGRWPWSRAQMAHLLENLIAHYGAKGVALDFIFPEAADKAGDTRLAALAGNTPLVMAQLFDYNGQHQVPLQVGQVAGGRPVASQGAAAQAVPANGYVANHPGLSAGARHVGNIGVIPDRDGVLRQLPMRTLFDGRLFPTLSLALLDCCAQQKNGAAPAGLAAAEGLVRIPYTRTWESYRVVAAEDILTQMHPVEMFQGKLVLVGSSSLSLGDRVATPLDKLTPGFLVHAAALSAMLDAQEGKTPTPLPGRLIATLFVAAVALVAAYGFPKLSAAVNAGMLIGASVLWVGLAYLLAPHDPDFSTTGPLLFNLFLLVVAVPFAWQMTQRQSRQLLGTLHQYVARAVVDELLRSDIADPLTPSLRTVTTLIADMEGYTGHVESLPVEEAAKLTRDFLDCLTGPVLARGGTLDKYTGDGLVAFWGAPLPNADHADLALDAAGEILQRVQAFSAAREAQGMPPLRVRIGVESGIAMAGDFGSTFRSIYTAVGDSVNTASRLQESARELPYDLIIGHGTASRSRRHELRLLGEKVLRGKENPTIIYTLMSATRRGQAVSA